MAYHTEKKVIKNNNLLLLYFFCWLIFHVQNRDKIIISGQNDLKLTGVMKLLIPCSLTGVDPLQRESHLYCLFFFMTVWPGTVTQAVHPQIGQSQGDGGFRSAAGHGLRYGAVIVHQTRYCRRSNCPRRCCFAVFSPPDFIVKSLCTICAYCDAQIHDQSLVSSPPLCNTSAKLCIHNWLLLYLYCPVFPSLASLLHE